MVMPPETPTLHLSLGSDADANRNWQILDDVMHRLARGVQIPDDLSILGSLDVRNNLQVGGDATVNGTLTANHVITGDLDSSGVLRAAALAATGIVSSSGGLLVSAGAVSFPDQSLDGVDFQKGATVQTVAVGTAQTTLVALTSPTPVALALVDLDAAEEQGRWQLVIAQATIRISFGASGSAPNIVVTLTLRRGPATDVQTRTLTYVASQAPGDGLDMDVPITIVRIAQPPDLAHQWSLWGSVVKSAGSSVYRAFAQLHTLQLR
jgi:hypothetical protein